MLKLLTCVHINVYIHTVFSSLGLLWEQTQRLTLVFRANLIGLPGPHFVVLTEPTINGISQGSNWLRLPYCQECGFN